MKINLSASDSLCEAISALKIESESEEIRIVLADGNHKGVFHDRIFYDLPNPLFIESESGDASNCVLSGENCEAFHKDTENRAIITFGNNCTK